jgi:hypothetical protein
MGLAVVDLGSGGHVAHGSMRAPGRPRARSWFVAPLLVALALLLVVGGGAEVQAQRRRGPTYNAFPILRVTVRPQQPRYRLCAGETKELLVDVSATMIGGFNLLSSGRGLPAPTTARNSAPTIATLTGKEDRPDNYGVPEPFRGFRYDLKGLRPGTGTLTFTARLPARETTTGPYDTWPAASATTTVGYEVKPCDYEISAVHIWRIPGTVPTASMDTIRVSADESGKLSGSGTLDWIIVHTLPACKTEDTVSPSGVTISGQVAEDGKVTLDLDYETASGTSSYECPAPCRGRCSGSESYTMVPSRLSLSFPGQGGSVTKKQPIPGGFRGSATITVTPVSR